MKKRYIASAIAIVLMFSAVPACLSGCGASGSRAALAVAGAVDLTAGIKPNDVTTNMSLAMYNTEAIDFAVRLFQSAVSMDKNSMISPFSVLYALAMTANGADGETLSQMEDVFGVTVGELNEYLHEYRKNLPSGDKNKLSIVNSIWFNDDITFTVYDDFLQTNADYYGASIY